MPRNIEIKAPLADLETAHGVARSIDAHFDGTEWQRDTYFRVPSGRLKLRERRSLSPQPGDSPAPPTFQLIWYQRGDAARPRPSDYVLVPIDSGDALRGLLEAALGVAIEVTKTRVIYLHDNVRIHLDRVEQLGTFIELEAIVDGSCDDELAARKIARLRQAFHIGDRDLHSVSYSDMIREQAEPQSSP